MKTQIFAAGFLMLSVMSPHQATAATFTGLYVFGDSLSDGGNVFRFSGGQIPQTPPYSQRLSNGKVWAEYLGDSLKLQPTLYSDVLLNQTIPTQGINFAIGGASSGFGNAVDPSAPLPGVLEQVLGFVQTNNQQLDPDALYTVWGGANDYLFPQPPNTPNPTQPYNNILFAVNSLVAAGAKNIVVFNLPDLGKLPGAAIPGRNADELTAATKEFNANLAQNLAIIRQNSNVNLTEVDAYALFNRWRQSPSQFGFSNVSDACLQFTSETTYITCNQQQEYLFWDGVHPTTATHKLIAESIFVPEPSLTTGALALGAVGAVGMLKRQRPKSALTSAKK